jgi:hypothetical protein
LEDPMWQSWWKDTIFPQSCHFYSEKLSSVGKKAHHALMPWIVTPVCSRQREEMHWSYLFLSRSTSFCISK